jgi:CRP-like cAMP-binding protein
MSRPANEFLSSLNESDFELLRPHLRETKLDHAAVRYGEGERIERAYFPHAGMISLVVTMADGSRVEAGMMGQEGIAGSSAGLDGARAANTAIVQVAGLASSVSSATMKSAAEASPSFRRLLYQHDQFLLIQAQQSAACNALHLVDERLCRWILRTRDALKSDDILLTQEFLSEMLGVRRTNVTLTAKHLQTAGLINYRRGHIQITDMEAMKEASCECYEAVNRQRERLFAPAN